MSFLTTQSAPSARLFAPRTLPPARNQAAPVARPRPAKPVALTPEQKIRKRAAEWPTNSHFFERTATGWLHGKRMADGSLKFDNRPPVSDAEYARMCKLYPVKHTPSFC
jgi:hypothetical protein